MSISSLQGGISDTYGGDYSQSGAIQDPFGITGGTPSPSAQSSSAPSFLAPTSDASSSSLSPQLASTLGVTGQVTPQMKDSSDQSSSGSPTSPNSISNLGQTANSNPLSFIENNPGTAGLLGLAAYTGLSNPQLPSASQTLLNSAGPGLTTAQTIINAGGATGNQWASQKGAIDAAAAQQLQQQTEAIKQAAANSGQSGMVVQQQIAQLQQNINAQTQQQYQAAQQQNVSAAISEMTASNSALSSVANTQLAQSNAAKQQAMSIASLGLQLSKLGGDSPGTTSAATAAANGFGDAAGGGVGSTALSSADASAIYGDAGYGAIDSATPGIVSAGTDALAGGAAADVGSGVAADAGAGVAADVGAGAAADAGAGGLADLAAAAAWVVCTELNRQGRLQNRWYVYGAKRIEKYDDRLRQGYFIWAVPSVLHLRSHPNSRYSRFLEWVFNHRAEYIAAQGGCRGARKTLTGLVMLAAPYAFCWVLSRTIARKPVDWAALYRKGA